MYLAFERPLWADEAFTLLLARRSFAGIFEALRLDSGPPLHYLASKLLLLPWPAPGSWDVLVRLLSVVAALLHVPLLLAVARRLGLPGSMPAVLFLASPLAVLYAVEGRGYAVASLLALVALERALATLSGAGLSAAASSGFAAGAAFLTHYLALFPLLTLPVLVVRARGKARERLLVAGLVATATVAPWLGTALSQPRASMAWSAHASHAETLKELAMNLGLLLDSGSEAPGVWLWGAGVVALLALFVSAFRSGARDLAAGVLLAGAALVSLGALGAVPLLPERAVVLLLPQAVLLAGALPGAARAALLAVSLAFLPGSVLRATRPIPSQNLAGVLLPHVRGGAHVLAVGLWGPELSYRLARAGYPDRVTLFPSDVARHPGWFVEELVPPSRRRREAAAVVSAAPPPHLVVLPHGSPASNALRRELAGRGESVGGNGLVEVFRVRLP